MLRSVALARRPLLLRRTPTDLHLRRHVGVESTRGDGRPLRHHDLNQRDHKRRQACHLSGQAQPEQLRHQRAEHRRRIHTPAPRIRPGHVLQRHRRRDVVQVGAVHQERATRVPVELGHVAQFGGEQGGHRGRMGLR